MVLWRLLYWCATACVRATADVHEANRDALLTVLGEATVDWGPEPLVSLAQIWEGFDGEEPP